MTTICVVVGVVVFLLGGLVAYALCRIGGLADRHMEEYYDPKNET